MPSLTLWNETNALWLLFAVYFVAGRSAMARRTAGALSRRARDRSSVFPKIVVEES